jgi:TonB family protein
MPLLMPETGAVSRTELSRKPFTLEPEPEPIPLGLPDLPTLIAEIASGTDGASAESSRTEDLWHGEELTRPRLISGESITYPQLGDAARERPADELQGTVVARCTLTTEGTLTDCSLLNRRKALDGDVLRILSTRRYTPAIYQGRPIAVRYQLHIGFSAWEDAPRKQLAHKSPEGPRCSGCLSVRWGPAAGMGIAHLRTR